MTGWWSCYGLCLFFGRSWRVLDRTTALIYKKKFEAVTKRKWIQRDRCLLWLLIYTETGKKQCICCQQNYRIVNKPAKVYLYGFDCCGCIFVLLRNVLAYFSNLKVAAIGQRSGEALPFYQYTWGPKAPEVHYAIPLSIASHKIKILAIAHSTSHNLILWAWSSSWRGGVFFDEMQPSITTLTLSATGSYWRL